MLGLVRPRAVAVIVPRIADMNTFSSRASGSSTGTVVPESSSVSPKPKKGGCVSCPLFKQGKGCAGKKAESGVRDIEDEGRVMPSTRAENVRVFRHGKCPGRAALTS